MVDRVVVSNRFGTFDSSKGPNFGRAQAAQQRALALEDQAKREKAFFEAQLQAANVRALQAQQETLAAQQGAQRFGPSQLPTQQVIGRLSSEAQAQVSQVQSIQQAGEQRLSDIQAQRDAELALAESERQRAIQLYNSVLGEYNERYLPKVNQAIEEQNRQAVIQSLGQKSFRKLESNEQVAPAPFAQGTILVSPPASFERPEVLQRRAEEQAIKELSSQGLTPYFQTTRGEIVATNFPSALPSSVSRPDKMVFSSSLNLNVPRGLAAVTGVKTVEVPLSPLGVDTRNFLDTVGKRSKELFVDIPVQAGRETFASVEEQKRLLPTSKVPDYLQSLTFLTGAGAVLYPTTDRQTATKLTEGFLTAASFPQAGLAAISRPFGTAAKTSGKFVLGEEKQFEFAGQKFGALDIFGGITEAAVLAKIQSTGLRAAKVIQLQKSPADIKLANVSTQFGDAGRSSATVAYGEIRPTSFYQRFVLGDKPIPFTLKSAERVFVPAPGQQPAFAFSELRGQVTTLGKKPISFGVRSQTGITLTDSFSYLEDGRLVKVGEFKAIGQYKGLLGGKPVSGSFSADQLAKRELNLGIFGPEREFRVTTGTRFTDFSAGRSAPFKATATYDLSRPTVFPEARKLLEAPKVFAQRGLSLEKAEKLFVKSITSPRGNPPPLEQLARSYSTKGLPAPLELTPVKPSVFSPVKGVIVRGFYDIKMGVIKGTTGAIKGAGPSLASAAQRVNQTVSKISFKPIRDFFSPVSKQVSKPELLPKAKTVDRFKPQVSQTVPGSAVELGQRAGTVQLQRTRPVKLQFEEQLFTTPRPFFGSAETVGTQLARDVLVSNVKVQSPLTVPIVLPRLADSVLQKQQVVQNVSQIQKVTPQSSFVPPGAIVRIGTVGVQKQAERVAQVERTAQREITRTTTSQTAPKITQVPPSVPLVPVVPVRPFGGPIFFGGIAGLALKPKGFSPQKPSVSGEGYEVFVRQKKRFVRVSKSNLSLERRDAERFGQFVVDNSTAKTFRKIKSTKPVANLDRMLPDLSFKFREKRNGEFVEKTRFGIDTQGEKAGLKAARVAAQLNRFVNQKGGNTNVIYIRKKRNARFF